MQDEFLINAVPANDYGMAGIVAALVTSNDIEMRGNQVNNLAFPFVAPLCADDCEIHEFPGNCSDDSRSAVPVGTALLESSLRSQCFLLSRYFSTETAACTPSATTLAN